MGNQASSPESLPGFEILGLGSKAVDLRPALSRSILDDHLRSGGILPDWNSWGKSDVGPGQSFQVFGPLGVDWVVGKGVLVVYRGKFVDKHWIGEEDIEYSPSSLRWALEDRWDVHRHDFTSAGSTTLVFEVYMPFLRGTTK